MNFNELPNPALIWNDGFMFQWCCKCKALHIWHFHIVRGRTEKKDYVAISVAGYPKLAKLRKFYEKNYKKNHKMGKSLKGDKNVSNKKR